MCGAGGAWGNLALQGQIKRVDICGVYLLELVFAQRRQNVSAEELVVSLKCPLTNRNPFASRSASRDPLFGPGRKGVFIRLNVFAGIA
jgi:hypothetical protein